MADPIGILQLFGDQAQKLFNRTSPGDVFTIRVRGTVQNMMIPNRPVGYTGPINQNMMGGQMLPCIIVEVEGVDP